MNTITYNNKTYSKPFRVGPTKKHLFIDYNDKTYGQYDHTNNRCSYIIVNRLLGESRPITEEQYQDNNFTLNQG